MSTPSGTAPKTMTTTGRSWKTPATSVNTRSGPGTTYAITGSYAEGTTVTVVCQYRNGETVTAYYGPKNTTISWPVWNRTSTGRISADLYSTMPANPGLPNC